MYFDAVLWRYTEGFRGRIAATVLVGLIAAAFGIARLALLGWLLGRVLAGAPLADLAWPAAGIALVMLLRGWLEHARTMLAHGTAAAIQQRLRRRLYDRLAELGPAWLGRERSGEVATTVIDGVEQLETYFGQYLPQLFVATLLPPALFVFLAFLDLPVALVLTGAALVTLIAPAAFHSWDQANSMRRSRAYGDFAAEFLDSIQGLATLKAFGQSRRRARMLAAKAHELFRSTMWVLATNSLSRGITDTGIAVGVAAALALGSWRVVDGEMAMPALLVILLAGVEMFRPLRDLRALLHQGMLGRAAAASVQKIMQAEPAVRDEATSAPVGIAPTIAFEDVRFGYPGARRQAHEGLSFAVAAGERVGIVGSSGAGKSTVVRLLLRLYDPDAGSVRIGGDDLRTLPLDAVRRLIAVVNQDTYLFHGTVEDNIRFGRPEATDAEIEAAARAANAWEFIARLPHGLDTVVGERGVRLSGGQRQRIAIARALLRDAPILVLDEALSAVDAENEAVIQEALNRLMQGRTTLIFAHRLSSVIDADRILALEGGRVAESGSHAELMARGGVYAGLMGGQAREAEGAARLPLQAAAAGPDIERGTGDERLVPDNEILKAEGLGWAGAVAALTRLIAPWRGRLAATFAFGVARVIAFIGVGVLGALAVAALKQGEPFEAWLWAMAAAAPLAGILHWWESWVAHDMAFRLLAEMRIALFRKLDELAPAYLLRRRSGDLVAIATHDVELVEYFFAHTVAPAFVALLVPAAVLAALLWSGWPMAVALLPFLLVVGLSPVLLRGRIDRLGSRAREALAELNAHVVDSVQGLVEIVAFQQERARGDALEARIERHHALRLPFFRDLSAQTAVLEAATGLGGLAVVLSGSLLVRDGALDAALLPLFSILAMACFLPVSEIAQIGRQLADTLGATRRLHAVERERPAVSDGPGAAPVAGAPALAFEGVAFSYAGARGRAVEDVDFAVPLGATVALVGASGAGKTTLAHLAMRFWDPDRGTVRVMGRDARRYRLDGLRDAIALVSQDTYLFNESLRANLLIAKPEASEAELARALTDAALSEFVAALPDGLETRVGERGMALSGGQRQRVAIARAFLKDAPVLILDEATSHLDAVSEQAVRRALAALMRGRTTLVIAHRLSTVRDADAIVVLGDGHVLETGSHEALLAAGGPYARLVNRQLAAAQAAE